VASKKQANESLIIFSSQPTATFIKFIVGDSKVERFDWHQLDV
jgi:hypothetical protein